MSNLYRTKSGLVTLADTRAGGELLDSQVAAAHDVTPGTAAAGKLLVVDGAKAITGLGDVTAGAITGTTATFSGAVSGATITGSGILTGSQRKARQASQDVGASGAIAIPAYSQTMWLTKDGVIAATLADPTATDHDGVRLTIVSTTARAHTVDNSAGSGFNAGGAGGDVATFGGAIGDTLTLEAYQGVWYVIRAQNVTFN